MEFHGNLPSVAYFNPVSSISIRVLSVFTPIRRYEALPRGAFSSPAVNSIIFHKSSFRRVDQSDQLSSPNQIQEILSNRRSQAEQGRFSQTPKERAFPRGTCPSFCITCSRSALYRTPSGVSPLPLLVCVHLPSIHLSQVH